MPVSSNNKFSRARRHLRSTQIDEKLQLLNEIPTNNTTSYYVIEPDVVTVIPPVRAEFDLDADDPALLGKDTSGLFDDNGAVLTQQPPGDTTYILGPMVSVFFPDGDYSAIGYVQKDTRKVINLARIPGRVRDWALDGTTEGFTSYSQLTLEQAIWYRDQLIAGDTTPYRVFYIGVFEQIQSEPGVTDPSIGVDIDEYGRWLGDLINLGYEIEPGRTEVTPGKKGPDPDMPPGIANLSRFGLWQKLISGGLEPLGNFFEPLSTYGYAGTAFGAFLLQQQGIVNYTETSPYEANLPPQDSQAISDALSDVMKTIPRERWENLNGADLQKINDVLNPSSGPTPSNPDRPANQRKNTDEYHNIVNNIGRSDAFKGQVKIDKDGNPYISGINDNYVFTNDADASVAGAPGLIKIFGQAFGAQGDPNRAGGGQYDYAGTSEPGAFDTSPDPRSYTQIKLKNMPIRVNLPAPTNSNVDKPSFNLGNNFTGGPLPESNAHKTKRIISEIKKPYVLAETKKEKIKYRPKIIGCDKTKVVGAGLMKQAEVPTSFKRIEDTMWKKQERKQNTRFSQERKNMILDSVGTSDHAWEWMTDRSKKKNEKSVYENFGQGISNQIVSKKKIGNDYIIKMYNEEGKLETITQSVLNERLQKQYELKAQLKEQETLNAPNDPLIKRVKNKLSLQIDYQDKPAKRGYPDNPPLPLGQDGYHVEYGDRVNYYNRLDRHSADTMSNPLTGNEKIDNKVLDQTTSAKVNKLIGKLRQKKKSKINTSLETQ